MRSAPSILRRLIRRGLQILALWLLLFAAMVYLIYRYVPQTYEAFSLLKVEPDAPRLYGRLDSDFGDHRGIGPYLETQVQLMTSGRVLKEVVNNPYIRSIPLIQDSKDPEADLRKKIAVEIVDEAFLIRVALELPDADEAAKIVNAVVDSYLEYTKDYKRSENEILIKSLVQQLKILDTDIESHQEKLKALFEKGTVEYSKPPRPSKNDADPTDPTFASYTEEQVQKIIDQMISTDLELIEAQATLEARLAANRTSDRENTQRTGKNLNAESGTTHSTQALNEAKIRVAALIKTKEKQARLFERLKIDKKPEQNNSVEATILNYEVNDLLSKRQQVKTNIDQLDFEAKREFFRVSLVDNATPPKIPSNSKMFKYMAVAPVGILLALIGLFVLVEIKAGRQSSNVAMDRQRDGSRDAPDDRPR
jgi:hypothetical protein